MSDIVALKPTQRERKGPRSDYPQQHGRADRGEEEHSHSGSRFPRCKSTSMGGGTCPVMPQKEKAGIHAFMGLPGCSPSCYEV